MSEIHLIGETTRELIVGARSCPMLVEYDIALAGITQAGKDFRFVRLQPKITQFILTLEGSGLVWENQQYLSANPGTVYLCPPGELHAYQAQNRRRWKFLWVIYANARKHPPQLVCSVPKLLPAEGSPLEEIIVHLHKESAGAGSLPALRHWCGLLHEYSTRVLQPLPYESRLAELWQVVSADLGHPWNLEELATRSGLSKEQLRRLSLRHQGVSPMRHLTRLRLARASELLTSRILTLEAIAEQVGYSDGFSLSHAFKRELGVSPTQLTAK